MVSLDVVHHGAGHRGSFQQVRVSQPKPAFSPSPCASATTDIDGKQSGTHRTYLSPLGLDPSGQANVASPRRAMGSILSNAVRFGNANDVLIAGEGIETMLSVREVMPAMPMAAATSSAHLAAIHFQPTLRRLYVARDRDAAGDAAFAILTDRTQAAGIELVSLMPELGDFNDDLRKHGSSRLPKAVVACPGNGINANLVDKASKLGIKVWAIG